MEITIKMELRPCTVNDRKALFHKWSEKSKIIEPSPMIGGHSGGVIKGTSGIIEYEDGTIAECHPYEIKFLDGKFKEYYFEERKYND